MHDSGTKETPPQEKILSSLLQWSTALLTRLFRDNDIEEEKLLGCKTGHFAEACSESTKIIVHTMSGEKLLPWWLYAPPQSPTTRWRTPLWRSFSAAPSAPERRWWSHLEQLKENNHVYQKSNIITFNLSYDESNKIVHFHFISISSWLEKTWATWSVSVLHSE